MKVRILGASGGEMGPLRTSAYLLNEGVLLDAGGASGGLSAAEVRGLNACVLTHSHLDHVASIPYLLEIRIGGEPLDVYAQKETIEALRQNLFSGPLFPDFERIPSADNPHLRFHEIEAERRFSLGGLDFLPVPVDHTVPTVGYLVAEGRSTVVFSADTAPTERIWEVVRDRAGVKCVFVEVSFPRRFDEVARLSKHLSTITLGPEIAKLPAGTPILLNHLKPAVADEIRAELAPFLKKRRGIEFAEQDRTYDF